jgi:hypothetical protein
VPSVGGHASGATRVRLPGPVILTILVAGCTEAPRGPYAFRDHGLPRIGGDYIEMIHYHPGKKDEQLRPPLLLYPPDGAVFCHFPRELVFRWEPAKGTPRDVEYLFQQGSVEQEPMFAYRTGKTTLNDRFDGAQPGRWRVKGIDRTGEGEWSEWRHFRFTP